MADLTLLFYVSIEKIEEGSRGLPLAARPFWDLDPFSLSDRGQAEKGT
jgi:hypothetical protein